MVVTLQPFLIHLTRLLSKNYTKSALKTTFYLNTTETKILLKDENMNCRQKKKAENLD